MDIGEKEMKKMDFNEYQTQTASTAIYPSTRALEYLALGVSSESGEIAGKVKKLIRDGYSKMSKEEWEKNLASEIGDVLWYLARLSDELGYSLEEIAQNNMDKLLDRKNRNVLKGSGDHR